MRIESIPVKEIKVRFRLRNPSEGKVLEIAESINQIDLINPVTIDSEKNLIAGFHRLLAFKHLDRKEIPCVVREPDPRFAELVEIDENLMVNQLSPLECGQHILRREEILSQLGLLYERGDNRFTIKEEKLSVEDLAESIGHSRRSYCMRKQIASNLHPEVQDLLVGTEFDILTELVKLSSEEDHIQLKVCNLLITRKCTNWKTAFYEAKYDDFKLNRFKTDRVPFNIEERYGTFPQSIMRFKKEDDELSKVVRLVNNNDHLRVQKGELNFGETVIKLHQMNPQQALFSLDYYTREGDLILDPFQGRGTTAITSLHLNRRFIGFEINKLALDRTSEVIRKNMDVPEDHWNIYEGCGCVMQELENQSELIDAVFTSPPYYLKAEPYSKHPRDLCNMTVEEFDQKIDELFRNLSRVIKTSDFKKRKFYPIIITVGTARNGANGILDMDCSFQNIAKRYSLTLWDKLFVQTVNPHLVTSIQRNYELRMVHKNYEVQMAWVKF